MNDRLVMNLKRAGYEALTQFERATDSVRVRCLSCGNEFEAKYAKLQSGAKKCTCQREITRLTRLAKNRAIMEAVAEARGGTLETKIPLRMHDMWDFRCAQGHTWSAQGQSVKGGVWCPACSGNKKRTLEELQQIVFDRGGKLNSTEYKGVDATYEFTCNLGHHFQNMFKKIEGGQWCPTCSRGSKSEEIARATFEHLFQVPFRKIRPKWLRNSRGRIMEIDGYSDELKIGFEYQGIQHFKDIGLYSTDVDVRIQDDALKYKLCEANGIKLFYLTYEDSYEDYPRRIKEQAENFGLDVDGIDFDAEIDLTGAYIREDRLAELKELLDPKGIQVLSKKWLTSDAKYSFECRFCGHKWQAAGNMFFNSRRVAGCQKCGWKQTAEKNRGSIQDLTNYATQNGGLCLSQEYVKRSWVYKWKCSKGHHFEDNFNNMMFRRTFCPQCEGRSSRTFVSAKEAKETFERFNLVLLSPYLGKQNSCLVRCQVCGEESNQNYLNLVAGKPPCKPCENLRKAKLAYEFMIEAGAKPLEPYMNMSKAWLCECTTCGRQISPSYINVKKGQGPCVYCGRGKKRHIP